MDNLYVTITEENPIDLSINMIEDPLGIQITNIDDEIINLQVDISEDIVPIQLDITEEPFAVVFATIVERGPVGPQGPASPPSWINYVVGYSTEPQLTTSVLPGELYIYAYQDATTLYRFIADDNSEDAFYETYENDTLSGLVATKRM